MTLEAPERYETITFTNVPNFDEFNESYGFLYVPSIPKYAYEEFKGLSYNGTQYTWDEVDYRLSIEYIPAIPEPSTGAIFLGIIALCMISFNKLIRRK